MGVIWGLFTWFGLAVVVPMLVVELRWPASLAIALQFAVLLYGATHLAIIVARDQPKWFDLIVWGFSYVWLGVAGLAQDVSEQNPYDILLAPHDQALAAVLALVGMFSYDIGRVLARRRRRPRDSDRLVSPRRTQSLVLAALILTPVAVALLGGVHSLTLTRTDRGALLVDRGLFTHQSKALGGLLLTASYALPLVASLGILTCLRFEGRLRRRVAWVAGALLVLILVLVVANPISASRYWVGATLLGVLFSLRRANLPGFCRLVALMVLAGLLALFPYADRFRYRTYVATDGMPLSELLLSKGDYDASVQMVNVISYVREHGLGLGGQLLGALGFAVPRQWWPTKPISTGTILAQNVGFDQANVSSPLWVEAYFDFGYVGVAAIFLLLGYFSVWLHRRNWIVGRSQSWRGVLACALPAYLPIVMRGSLLSSVAGLSVIVLLAWTITTPGSRRPVEPPRHSTRRGSLRSSGRRLVQTGGAVRLDAPPG